MKSKHPPFIKANADKIHFTKLESAMELQKLDHCFLYPWAVKILARPFGFDPKCETHIDTRFEHKGLHCPDVNEGDAVAGMDAMHLSVMLCRRENLEYASFHGRGSQLAECTQRIIDHERKHEYVAMPTNRENEFIKMKRK